MKDDFQPKNSNANFPGRLTVGLVGVFENPHSTSHMIAASLAAHSDVQRVDTYDYRQGLKRSSGQVGPDMIRLAKKCHLLIILKGNHIPAEVFRRCARHCMMYLYWMDWWPNMVHDRDLLRGSQYCHWRSMTAFGDISRWEKKIGLPVYHVVDGADTQCFRPLAQREKKIDILFVGSRDNERKTIHDTLQMMGFNVQFFGPGFTRFVSPKEFNVLCAKSKIILNLFRGQSDGSTSVRLWNILCSGTMVITKKIPKMSECLGLEEGRHLASFSDFVDFDKKAKLYLKHERLRESVGREGRTWVIGNRTWAHTADDMIKLVRITPPASIQSPDAT